MLPVENGLSVVQPSWLKGVSIMATDLFSFTWPVANGGYQFVDGMLVEREEPRLASYRRPTLPPALFRVLADVPPTEAGVVEFANQWGTLGVREVMMDDAGRARILAGQIHGVFKARFVELLYQWLQVISELRQAVWLWDRLAADVPEKRLELGQRVIWKRDAQGRPLVVFDSHPRQASEQAETDDGYLRVTANMEPSGLIENELVTPSRTFLCDFVNRNLRGTVSPRLLPDRLSAADSGLSVRAAPLQLSPTDLAAACWLQLALVVSGMKAQRQCQGCGRWFEAHEKRSDAVWCGDACRKQAHQEKRLRAFRLRASGKRVREIAVELGVDEKKVKDWLAKKRGK
jgi:hypothetical protein